MTLPTALTTGGVKATAAWIAGPATGGQWRELVDCHVLGGRVEEPPPEAGTLTRGTVASTSVDLSWTAPSTGTVTGYTLVVTTGATTVRTVTMAATARSRSVGTLTPSTAYTFTLSATTAGDPIAYTPVTATTTAGGGTVTRMLGVYSGDTGQAALAAFDRYPDCTSSYHQHGEASGMRTKINTIIGNGITPFVTVSFKDYLNAAGGGAIDGARPNAYSIVAAGRAASPAAYDAVIALVDGWARNLEVIATATATTNQDITVYACMDSEPDAKTNASNPNGLVINATMAEMGKWFKACSLRFRELAPNVKYGVWFAQSRKTQILEILAELDAEDIDWISADPYTNGSSTPGSVTQTWQGCVTSKWTEWFRNEPTGAYERLGSPPLAVTEFGISNGASWDFGAGPRAHTDQQIALYYTDLRDKMALTTVNVFAAILFDSARDQDHIITREAAPLSPLAIAAFKASLEG